MAYSQQEKNLLLSHFTNCDEPIFAIKNLPEVIKASLFARYSRTHKPLRRLFLDEFIKYSSQNAQDATMHGIGIADSQTRAQNFFERVFVEYGDDSVAQLGGAHVACEQVSSIAAKALEWGRLAAYLEQSTRYLKFDKKINGRYRYKIPPELKQYSGLTQEYCTQMDSIFNSYSQVLNACINYYNKTLLEDKNPTPIMASSIRAKACDIARELLPTSTTTNVGIFASGQAFEMALVRLRSHPLSEVRQYGDAILKQLQQVIPSFVKRTNLENRGALWSKYLSDVQSAMQIKSVQFSNNYIKNISTTPYRVALTDWDTNAEAKLVSAIVYPFSNLSDDKIMNMVNHMSQEEKTDIIKIYCGNRVNRRNKPGRAFERINYRFDILSDYGTFRDLQRHRIMTIEWQLLSPLNGFAPTPEIIEEVGKKEVWNTTVERSYNLWEKLHSQFGKQVAQYALLFGHNIRYSMQMNAREAMHIIELRTTEQGHDKYRKICLQMYKLIKEQAGHKAIADAIKFVNHSASSQLPRIKALQHAHKMQNSESDRLNR